jgi:methane/ammonia monooxygenase subunit A
MSPQDREILALGGFRTRDAIKLSRSFDYLVVAAAFLLFTGAVHLHVMLSVGDWDMFIDWKDRQYWVLVTPISFIIFPAAVQAIFWTFFRLPIGATLCALTLLFGTWVTRYVGWHVWSYFPFPMVVPATMLAGALAMDAILLLTRNAVFTAVFGGFAFSLLFYPSNWVALAPYFLPVEHLGKMASVADLIGYTYPRSGTPEYIRIIERGTLRTFEGTSVWVSTFFAGFVCIFMHLLWWKIGLAFSTVRFWPNSRKVKHLMGIDDAPAAQSAPGAMPERVQA